MGHIYLVPGIWWATLNLSSLHTVRSSSFAQAPYAINVFIPLVDITVENGGTEFWLATHRLNHFEDEQQSVVILAKAGQPLLFDYRIRHRGLANRSQQPRPLLYVTFARASYEDKVRRLRHASLATTHVNTSAGYQRLFCHRQIFQHRVIESCQSK
jgi:ectoine hydroxylase-related dioxygenase (phytanoyl-CoA dioxygenase family)